jgi:tRNA(fMet)-specific endonuclease VapC
MKAVLVDTNAYAALMRGEEKILAILSSAECVYISTIVLGELYAGFKGGSREEDNCRILQEFLSKSTVRVVSVSHQTAEIFGHIKHQLRTAGTPLPINDVWIAAHAMQYAAVLISYDAHFSAIPGLRIQP